jgi:hypothetical protein
VSKWEDQLRRWKLDHSQPNPFEGSFKGTLPLTIPLMKANPYTAISQDQVKLQLSEQEATEMKEGQGYALHEEISASLMLTMGMDFEQQQ